MGNASTRITSFNDIPNNEFSPCAVMLKRMGIRLVVMSFQDMIESKNLEQIVYHRHLYVPQYTEKERNKLTSELSERISTTASEFSLALLTKGIQFVVIIHPGNFNGSAFTDKLTHATGYIYEGRELGENVMKLHFGSHVAQFIHIQEADDMIRAVKATQHNFKMKNPEILVIHHNAAVITSLRKQHMSGILVDDHRIGFRM